jgi:hypothetical protein
MLRHYIAVRQTKAAMYHQCSVAAASFSRTNQAQAFRKSFKDRISQVTPPPAILFLLWPQQQQFRRLPHQQLIKQGTSTKTSTIDT